MTAADERVRAAAYVLRRVQRFSRYVLRMPLHPYQLAPLQAVLESVLARRGQEFLLVFPRQSGKNEAAAHLLAYLLNLLQRRDGNIVYAAIGDSIGRGVARLEARLDNPLNRRQWRRKGRPIRRCLGRACVAFISSHPQAHSRGETAHWLLVVDELQDQSADHIEAVLTPMRAANNATALYMGTVRTRHDALWRKMSSLKQRELEDGVQRVFMVPPAEVTAANPAYGDFLAEQVARYGRHHPTIRAEYFLEPLDGAGGLFPERRLVLMQGRHPRQHAPLPHAVYVATVDVGGQDEVAPSGEAAGNRSATGAHPATNSGRDYTVATVFELVPPQGRQPGPVFQAVTVFVDQGSRHFADEPARPRLADRLAAFLELWAVQLVVIDATGVGAGLADWLGAALGADRVSPFIFSRQSKAELGSRFITLIETGRFSYWTGDEDEPLSDGWWFRQQAAHCGYDLEAGQPLEKGLRWGVPDGLMVSTPAGRLPVHDDRLVSAALAAEAERLLRAGRRVGAALSEIVPPEDPLAELSFT